MKVYYPLTSEVSLNVIKETIKPFGGRCAKVTDGKLEYMIAEDKAQEAYQSLKDKGLVS